MSVDFTGNGSGAIQQYGQFQAPVTQSTVTVESARAMAEIQAAVYMAKQFPRDCLRCRENILKACQRPNLAKTATYQYVRGGAGVSGPSIRLAEVIANEWGNIRYGFIELEQTQYKTVAQAFAWNVETNVKCTRTITIKHERYTKQGSKYLNAPRDIYECVANLMQRRVRACILAVVPGDIVEEAVEECEKTLRATADTSPDGIKKLIESFRKIGVSRLAIEKKIQRNIESITAANIVSLRGIFSSIKDGIGKPEDYFEMPEEQDEKRISGMKKQLIQSNQSTPVLDVIPSKSEKSKPDFIPFDTPSVSSIQFSEMKQRAAEAQTLSELSSINAEAESARQAGEITSEQASEITKACTVRKKALGVK